MEEVSLSPVTMGKNWESNGDADVRCVWGLNEGEYDLVEYRVQVIEWLFLTLPHSWNVLCSCTSKEYLMLVNKLQPCCYHIHPHQYFVVHLMVIFTCLLTSAMVSCKTINISFAPRIVVLSDSRTRWHSLLKILTIVFRLSSKIAIVPVTQHNLLYLSITWLEGCDLCYQQASLD